MSSISRGTVPHCRGWRPAATRGPGGGQAAEQRSGRRRYPNLLSCCDRTRDSETNARGIDLNVLATSFREIRGEFLSTASLRFERDPALFARLAQDATPCGVRPLPPGLRVGHHEDDGLTWPEADRYGRPLTFTTPADLRRLEVPPELDPWNRAVLAFLLALPGEARIVVFWC